MRIARNLQNTVTCFLYKESVRFALFFFFIEFTPIYTLINERRGENSQQK